MCRFTISRRSDAHNRTDATHLEKGDTARLM